MMTDQEHATGSTVPAIGGLTDEQLERSSRSSTRSHRTSVSRNSNLSDMIAAKQAEAESARVSLQYARKEADLLKQQALMRTEMETDIKLLEKEKEIAVAEAQVRVLRASSEPAGRLHHSQFPADVPEEDPAERTKRYVSTHVNSAPERDNHNVPLQDNVYDKCAPQQSLWYGAHPPLNPNAPPFHHGSDITHYLLKKDLLISRLRNFNDKPEAYPVWKASFCSIMGELHVTANEEFDLLVKCLGSESSKHALSLRAANIHDPNRGLLRIWERLDERYGSPEMIESSLKSRLSNFPKLTNRDFSKLYELSDLLSEVESIKCDEKYGPLLAYFDSSSGVTPIVNKLPFNLQEKWSSHAFRYKERHRVTYPPFSVFTEFIRETSKLKNDPSFQYDNNRPTRTEHERPGNAHSKIMVHAKKTEVSSSRRETECNNRCPIHKTGHTLNECNGFKAMTLDERKEVLKKHGMCYKCCLTSDHMAKACKEDVRCAQCGSSRHATALHTNRDAVTYLPSVSPKAAHSGEKRTKDSEHHDSDITSKCTQVCERPFQGKSCAKCILVKVYSQDRPEQVVKTYALVDDQSNASLARSELFDLLNIQGEDIPYTLTSCGGLVKTSGRRACNLVVESLDGTSKLNLPTITECNAIPSLREEIPTPEVARHHAHLKDIEQYIPSMDDDSSVLLLIGRDLIQAHHVLDQRVGAGTSPYAQRLSLGWVIIGESCLGKVHIPDAVNVCKTSVLNDGRASIFKPCTSVFDVREDLYDEDINSSNELPSNTDSLGRTVFYVTPDDEKAGTSIEDRQFLQIMGTHMHRNSQGNWEAPLPFRSPKVDLPNNRQQALRRAKALDRSLQRSPGKKQHMIDFMDKILQNKHAEVPPPLQEGDECWYLPLFGIYHPKKPSQIRVVFDSSALYDGKSLNNALLQGPDLANCLLGVLLRFRREAVAVMGDIQQMFHCFSVREDHRNYLRFIWYKDNDPLQDLIEYRMCVHVFGNRPSPAVASYRLKRTAKEAEAEFGEDVRQFIERDFYVDDGLTSLDTAEQAIYLMKRSQEALRTCGNLRLCKIVSNSSGVMEAFPSDDRAKDLKNLKLSEDSFPLQRCLGIAWDINFDSFTFTVSCEDKPFTKRGVLSTINSLFDPMGFAAPVLIKGKIILRDLMADGISWDDPLPPERQEEWELWRNSLKYLEEVQIPRVLLPVSFRQASEKELHVFADASEKAIAAVAYVKVIDKGDLHSGFVMGKAKVSPTHGHTIPRLELCAAVLATDVANLVTEHLDIPRTAVSYHTDSKIVLGYICNESKRFSVYVANRVARIRRASTPGQWRYVSTDANPADCATRSVPATTLGSSPWLLGPPAQELQTEVSDIVFSSSECEVDCEAELDVAVLATNVNNTRRILGTQRFERFSSWKKLVETIIRLKRFAKTYHLCKSDETCKRLSSVEAYTEAEKFVLRQVQLEAYREEVRCLKAQRSLPKSSSILNLNPVLDEDGLLRVGGRFNYTDMAIEYKNPIVIPGRHHVATLLVRHYHERVKHQGRHFTEGSVRAAGLWITGIKRVVSSLIHDCVKCRKLRGKEEQQVMSNLPTDRLQPNPPFSYVGVDVFGPWSIVTRGTRGGQANSKRWAVLFTCLTTRGIHIEVIEDMTSSSFVNAVRRFVSIRGKVRQFRSDHGTNFVGATDMLKIHAINVEDHPVKRMLSDNQCEWIFNPPQSSHMGGAWERLIGVSRRILDAMMAEASSKPLTHEVLTTFMAEVCAIVNGRPIVPVSSDPNSPLILTPATLLTQKVDHTTEPLVEGDVKDMYKAQWRRVQALAETFWSCWKSEYLHLLQVRRKWQHERPNVRQGDVVLLKDKNCHRNEWPTGVLVDAISSEDGKVRKAVVRVHKDGKGTLLTRPITDMVVLVSAEGRYLSLVLTVIDSNYVLKYHLLIILAF